MNILLAVDGSSFTKKMLAYLATHEELLAPTHTFTAVTVQAALPPRARAALGKPAVDQYYADEADKVLNPVGKFLERHGFQLKRIAKVGPAGETISKLADAGQFDLLSWARTATAHWPRWSWVRSPPRCWPNAKCLC